MSHKVVLVHGVFDLLHRGHIYHLQQAAKMGDRLVVSVVADEFTHKKVIYRDSDRVQMLKALRCVNDVWLCRAPGPEKIIRALEPDLYVRGADYRGKTMPELALLHRLGIPVRYTKSLPIRTSEIIERLKERNYGS